MLKFLISLSLAICLLLAPPAVADDGLNLLTLGLEELMEIEITLVSRKQEKLFDTAAAAYALTGEDLRRSGATSIPEALRLVPGMQVGHIGASMWAVSARGFADRFANKMLVLIDGRHVYSPLFSGVYWESHDVLLEDVERIEVIRGPGATLWGANAVNGIINITTVAAAESQGGLVKVGAGTEERGFATVRYGGRLGNNSHFRIFARGFDRDDFVDAAGKPTADDMRMLHSGFRADWKADDRDAVSVQGDLFTTDKGQRFSVPIVEAPYMRVSDSNSRHWGGNLLISWERSFSSRSDMRLQLYYDHNDWVDESTESEDATYDLDFQHRFSLGGRQEIVWGLGYRRGQDETREGAKLAFIPTTRSTDLYSAFVHHETGLYRGQLILALGSKFEHNGYSGFEFQPSARLIWHPDDRHALWLAVSRSVRTPSRSDRDIRINARTSPTVPALPGTNPIELPLLLIYQGQRSFGSEKLHSFELGYRLQPRRALFVDLATFYSRYSDLRAGRIGLLEGHTDAQTPYLTAPVFAENLMDGRSYGGELTAEWQFPDSWGRLRAAYSYLHLTLDPDPVADPASVDAESVVPEHQFYIWPSVDLNSNWQLDCIGRYVGDVSGRGKEVSGFEEIMPEREIDAYFELDLRLGWQPSERFEIELVGRNLVNDQHAEFTDFFLDYLPTEAQREVYGSLTWHF